MNIFVRMSNSMQGMLLDCYTQYVGEIEEVEETNVYAGAGMLGVGFAAAVFGWLLFLWNETGTYGTEAFWTLREVSVALVGLGAPVLLLGAVTLLLGRDRVTALAMVGATACTAAVLLFVVTYPAAWDVPGALNSALGVSVYAAGLLGLAFATGAAFSCRIIET
jgi:hypothetical protein